jgi:FMN reductase
LTPSRTRLAADFFSAILADLGGEVTTVDLATISVDGLAHGRPEEDAQAALGAVLDAEIVLVVTPVYKASYTGLLKILLDCLPDQALRDKVVMSVIVGAWPGHFLVLEHALRPVLAALGATTPSRGLLVIDKQIDRTAGTVAPEVLDDFRAIAIEAVRLRNAIHSSDQLFH